MRKKSHWLFWNVKVSYRNMFTYNESITNKSIWVIILGIEAFIGDEYRRGKNEATLKLTFFNQNIIIRIYDKNYHPWGITN